MITHVISEPIYDVKVLLCLQCGEEEARTAFMHWYVKNGGEGNCIFRDTTKHDLPAPVESPENEPPMDDRNCCGYIPNMGRFYGLWIGNRCGDGDPIDRIACIGHEVTHIAVGVMGHVGIPIEVGNDEAMAYYHQFLQKQVLKNVYLADMEAMKLQAVRSALRLNPDDALNEVLDQIHKLKKTVGFFASVIKSGEPWTESCQSSFNEAFRLYQAPADAPEKAVQVT